MEVIMKREELIAMGISEEDADKIMADYGSAVQRANAKAEQYKAKAEKADELQTQIDDLNSQNLSDIEKANKELEKANQRIAELEKNDEIKTQRSLAMEKFKVTAEQAKQIVKDDGSLDYDILGQIISDKESASATAKEQEIADNATNPGGGSAGGTDTKPDDVKNAESITFGTQASEQSEKDYYVMK